MANGNNQNNSIGFYDDKGFSHYAKWGIAIVIILVTVLQLMIAGTVAELLKWLCLGVFIFVFGERVVKSLVNLGFQAGNSIPTQVIEPSTLVSLPAAGVSPSPPSPQPAAPAEAKAPEAPVVVIAGPPAADTSVPLSDEDYQDFNQDTIAVFTAWFARAASDPPLVPEITVPPEMANKTPDERKAYQFQKAMEVIREQWRKVFNDIEDDDVLRSLPCEAKTRNRASQLYGQAKQRWISYAGRLVEWHVYTKGMG